MNIFQKVISIQAGAPRWATDLGLLALRLWLGLSLAGLHGWGKFEKLLSGGGGFPDPLGIGSSASLLLASSAELFASLFLAAGLLTRLAAVPLAFTMGVAFFVVHGGALRGPGSGELAFVYLAGFVALLLAGPGRYSLDAMLAGRRRR